MVSQALSEDLGPGDLTAALLPADQIVSAQVITRESGILCGRDWFDEVFAALDPQISVRWHNNDGELLPANHPLCELQGPARTLLSGERVALNFLQTLSGTASMTRRYVDALAGTSARLLDTRKTIPLWRLAQKYAVCCGGGHNHRLGLYDMILIKENHIAAAGSIASALQQAQQRSPGVAVEIEVESVEQLHTALRAGARRILLDNMDHATLRRCVQINAGQAQLEASGNVRLETIREIALTGVDFISVGSLTKHLHALDLSLRIQKIHG